jgi:hypothetical protein
VLVIAFLKGAGRDFVLDATTLEHAVADGRLAGQPPMPDRGVPMGRSEPVVSRRRASKILQKRRRRRGEASW